MHAGILYLDVYGGAELPARHMWHGKQGNLFRTDVVCNRPEGRWPSRRQTGAREGCSRDRRFVQTLKNEGMQHEFGDYTADSQGSAVSCVWA